MDKSSASRKSWKTSTRRQIRETLAIADPEDEAIPMLDALGGSHTRIIRKAIRGANLEKSGEEELGSRSSSSLGLSSGEDREARWGIRMRRLGLSNRPGREGMNRVIEKLGADANREIQEIKLRPKGKSVETQEEAGVQQGTTC